MKFLTANHLTNDDKFVENLLSVLGELDTWLSKIDMKQLGKFTYHREMLRKRLDDMNDQKLIEHCKKDKKTLKAKRDIEKRIS